MNAPLPGFGTSGVTSTERRIEHFGGATGSSAFTVCVASSVRTAPAAMATTLALPAVRFPPMPLPALRCPQILGAWRDAGYRTKVQSGPLLTCVQSAELRRPSSSSTPRCRRLEFGRYRNPPVRSAHGGHIFWPAVVERCAEVAG